MKAKPPPGLTEHEIELLAQVGCQNSEIAQKAGISEATLKRKWQGLLNEGRAELHHRNCDYDLVDRR